MTAPKSIKSQAEDKTDNTIGKSVPTLLVDPRTLVMQESFNGRPIDPEHVAVIKAAKRAGTIFPPLVIRGEDGARILVDGHHRLTADLERIAEGDDVDKVLCMEFKGDEADRIMLMVGSADGKPLTPLQLGVQYALLVNSCGWSYAKIAERRGRSVQHVKDYIRLTEQSSEIKDMIDSGEVKAATALKLVKKEGAKAAAATLRSAKTGLVAGLSITQKVIDNLAKNVVTDAAKRTTTAGEHLLAMLESPAFDGPTKSVLSDALALVTGKTKRIATTAPDPKMAVREWLADQKTHANSHVKGAAYVLHDACCGKPMPVEGSPGAQAYGNMVWLQDMAATSKEPTFRAAAHWFMAVLDAKRSGRELAPAPSVLSLEDALRSEMESNGSVLAETLCPEQTDLIKRIRGRA